MTDARYHKHSLYFFSKWKEAEMGNLHVVDQSTLKMLETEIGRGCFGTCFSAKYGARTVVVKQQQNCQASKHEARMIARLSHPNTVCFISIVVRENRIDIVTNFDHVNGER